MLPAAAMYLAGVAIAGVAIHLGALAAAGLLSGWPRGRPDSPALLLAPVAVVAAAVVLGRFTLGRAAAPADRTGVAIGAGIGPASLLVGWAIAAIRSVGSYDLSGLRDLGWQMMIGFRSSGLLVAVALALFVGAGLGLLQTSRRRSAGMSLGVGALCALAAVVPVALYNASSRWYPGHITNPTNLLYLLVAYIAPAATSGLITFSSYRMAGPRVGGVPGAVPMGVGAMPGAYPAASMPGPAGSFPPAAPGAPVAYGAPGYGLSPTNGLAVAALVCSLLSLFCGVGAILGVIFGAVALRQIKASGGWQRGRGMAIAGLVIGTIILVITVLYIVLVVAVASSGNSY